MSSGSVCFYCATDLYKPLSFPKEIKQTHIITTLSVCVVLCVRPLLCAYCTALPLCQSAWRQSSITDKLEGMWEKGLWHNARNIQEFAWSGI
jgi:hypothetical protein